MRVCAFDGATNNIGAPFELPEGSVKIGRTIAHKLTTVTQMVLCEWVSSGSYTIVDVCIRVLRKQCLGLEWDIISGDVVAYTCGLEGVEGNIIVKFNCSWGQTTRNYNRRMFAVMTGLSSVKGWATFYNFEGKLLNYFSWIRFAVTKWLSWKRVALVLVCTLVTTAPPLLRENYLEPEFDEVCSDNKCSLICGVGKFQVLSPNYKHIFGGKRGLILSWAVLEQ